MQNLAFLEFKALKDMMIRKKKKGLAGFPDSVRNALTGLKNAVLKEKNIRIDFAISFFIISFSFMLRLSALEKTAIIVACFFVIAAELFNTALETICDFMHPEFNENIGYLKDTAASAVLFMAFGAAAVGIYIFFVKGNIRALIGFFTGNPMMIFLFLILIIISILFINGNILQYKNIHDMYNKPETKLEEVDNE